MIQGNKRLDHETRVQYKKRLVNESVISKYRLRRIWKSNTPYVRAIHGEIRSDRK